MHLPGPCRFYKAPRWESAVARERLGQPHLVFFDMVYKTFRHRYSPSVSYSSLMHSRGILGEMWRVAGVAVVVWLLVIASGCQSHPSPPPPMGTVQGQVLALVLPGGGIIMPVSLPSPAPKAGVTVTFSGGQSGRSVTDSDGRFSVRLKPGVYTVRLDATLPSGYRYEYQFRVVRGPTTVNVQAGLTTQADYMAYFEVYPPVP